jgi:anaerobic ribonucleoside-triphosphate reductase activating protein
MSRRETPELQMPGILNVHSIIARSSTNGPGMRMAIWLQGCSHGCPGCFNPETHSLSDHWLVAPDRLATIVQETGEHIEGVTMSGGEPLQQAAALLPFLRSVKTGTTLSVVLFSGFTMSEIEQIPEGPEILACTDVLVAGRFVQEKRRPRGLRGSSNQRLHLLSKRYTLDAIADVPDAEVFIDSAGKVHVTGLDPPHL